MAAQIAPKAQLHLHANAGRQLGASRPLHRLCARPSPVRLRRARAAASASGDAPAAASEDKRATMKKKKPYGMSIDSIDDDLDGAYCSPSFVTVDNESNDKFTVLRVECQDYPGLFRVLAWTMNGLEIRVQNAKLFAKEGMVDNKFWVTNYDGKKLTTKYADICAERISDFALYCQPDKTAHLRTEFSAGNVSISNSRNPKYTVLTIRGEPDRLGFLLEVVSVISGLGLSVREGMVQSCKDCGTEVDALSFNPEDGRTFEFQVTNSSDEKLDRFEANSVLFVLGLLMDPNSKGPTVAPDSL